MNTHIPSARVHVAWRKSLATQLNWASVLIVVITLLTVGAGLIWIARQAQREGAFQLHEKSADKVALLISSFISHAASDLQLFEDLESLGVLAPAGQKNAVENLLIHRSSLFSQLTLLSKDGVERIKSSRFHTFLPNELTSQATNPAFLSAITGQTHFSPVYLSPDSGLLSMQISVPVKGRGSEIVGVLIAESNVTRLWQEVSGIQIGRSGYAYLVDVNGRFVAYQEPVAILQRYGEDMSRMPPVAEFMAAGPEGVHRIYEYRGLNNVPVIGLFMPVQGTDWAVIVELPIREAYASLTRMQWYWMGLMFIGVAAAGGLGFFVSRRLVHPLSALTLTAKRMGEGDLDAEIVDVRHQDEVGMLAGAFRQMQKALKDLYKGLEKQVAELKRTERALRESEEKYRVIFENSGAALLFIEEDMTISMVNREFENLSGYSKTEVEGRMKWKDFLVKPDDAARITESQRAGDIHPEESASRACEFQFIGRDGQIKDLVVAVAVLSETRQSLAALLDIAERKRAEEALEKSMSLYRLLAENISDVIWTMDMNLRFTYLSPSVFHQRGYTVEEVMSQSVEDFLTPASLDDAMKAFAEELEIEGREQKDLDRTRVIEIEQIRKDGSTIWTEVKMIFLRDDDAHPVGILGVTRDITERKRAEAERERLEKRLRQSQKMEAVGTLAGGIAHDFNNILMAITGHTELALHHAPEGSPLRHNLLKILKADYRAADLVKQILAFSRQSDQERKSVSIVAIIEEVLKLLRSTLPSTIQIRHDVAVLPEGGLVLADSIQIHQVIMNLCVNAAYAMRDQGGILSVALSEFQVDAYFLSKHPNLHQAPCVRLSVSDTGCGMEPEVVERIFEPYFTTKGLGEGTGLGLAVVQGIVKNHGGAIEVYSEPGQGTSFHVFLPMIAKTPAVNAAVEAKEALPIGKERILFVDDEKILADLGQEILESLGYDVVTHTNSLEALETFRIQSGAFDLVITDMTMPGLTGKEFASEILAIRPDIPIILCTGFSVIINEQQAKEAGIREFVMKPYSINSLADTVRKVLDEKG
ncbi:MAG: PAS domain S-box protein [Deltaproteobacteria bacterium]|nr:PAS domain S-box protein [Deltaproteobacteria bacterium]